MKRNTTTKLVVTALLIAINIVLTRFFAINIGGFLRLDFAFIIVAFYGILLGPIKGGIAAAVADIIGALLFPVGPYFFGFTVTAFLKGATFGLFLHKKDKLSFKDLIIPSAISLLILNLILNSIWIYMIIHKGLMGIIMPRIVKELIYLPMYVILITFAWNTVMNSIPDIRKIKNQ